MRTAAAPAAPQLHVFKAGRHTTMAGEVIEFSQADIEATAKAYDPALSRAPVVVGHPKTDDPAQGWVVGMAANARGLYAAVDQVDPAFAEAVRAGRYGTISTKFYRPTDAANPKPGVWYPRHIGFLGAMPPAVKGLEPPQFAAAADDDGVCFAEGVAFGGWEDMTAATLWRNLREWLLTRFGQADADQVLPAYQVRDLETAALSDVQQSSVQAAFAEPAPAAQPVTPSTTQEPTVTDQEAAQLREQNAAQQRELEQLRTEQAQRRAQEVLAENAAFAEGLARDARIPTAQAGLVAAIGAELQRAAPDVQFGEGDARQPLHAAFRALMQALPAQTSLAEQATRERAAAGTAATGSDDAAFAEGTDPERIDLDRRITAYATEHKLSYAQAASAVMRGRA